MKTFPTIVLTVFIGLALVGVVIFATYSSLSQSAVGKVVIWGSFPIETVSTPLGILGQGKNDYKDVTYQSLPADTLISSLVAAIAEGRGPDLVLFPADDLVAKGDTLATIPYSALSRRAFQDTFIKAGEVFLTADGMKAIPFTVDPLVMYWNRSLFSKAGIAVAPKYWDEVATLSPKLTQTDANGTLTLSTTALGTWDNVTHAKAILVSLMHQLGTPIVTSSGTTYTSVLRSGAESGPGPASSALRFYTDFADPAKPNYSWNRSQQSSHDAFIAGTLGLYFGYASELGALREANPNLDFDVASLPQVRGGSLEFGGSFGELTGLAIPRGAKNPNGALVVAQALSGAVAQQSLFSTLQMQTVRRDGGGENASDPYAVVFRNATLSAFAFLDPSPEASEAIFKRMVESISSGKSQVSDAVQSADADLQALFKVQ